ncbi:MAG: glycosyl transferase family protein [Hyphomicrobiales bacterium]|nr:glycosyl transferase family protein [Hyphomicrobiales bacterium]
MQEIHPFSKFIAILGRGKTKQRALTIEESREAMGMLLRGETEREQIGAFLMLLRLKEESPEEIAGFALAVKDQIKLPKDIPPEQLKADVDWSSYAGKRRQLPWYILSALLLARNGYKVFMHGTEWHTPGRVYTRECLNELGVPVSVNYQQVAENLAKNNFAYMPLEAISEPLKAMIGLKPILGLRSPVHSFARMINPLDAPVEMIGIFHRGFMDIHANAGILMNQPHLSVFRGEGGEAERRPGKTCEVWNVHGNDLSEERWPAILDEPRQAPDESMNIADLAAHWRGETSSQYASAAVIGTLAITIKTMGLVNTIEEAELRARQMWDDRDRSCLPAAA